jgi:hypothetical protein
VRALDTYAEVSPSQTGVKLLFTYAATDLPKLQAAMGTLWGRNWTRGTGLHPPGIELALGNKYFTITDLCLPDAPHALMPVATDVLFTLIQVTGPEFEAGGQEPPDWHAWLERYGLTAADAGEAGVTYLTPDATCALTKKKYRVPSLMLWYWQPRRPNEAMTTGAPDQPFYRLRFCADVFGKDGRLLRYWQPSGSLVRAYFPRLRIDWPQIIDDPREPIIITEGEFKAAKACHEGFATIGLGGVWNFGSSKRGIPFLDELTEVTWQGRTVYIGFDHDPQENPDVTAAVTRLARLFIRRGAVVKKLELPAHDNSDRKNGLDDFLIAHGRKELQRLIDTAELFIPRPRIEVRPGKLDAAATAAEAAIVAAGLPIFQRNRQLVMPVNVPTRSFENRETMQACFKVLDDAALLDDMCATAEWGRWDERSRGFKTVNPPDRVVSILRSRFGKWNFPQVVGLVTTPTLRPDGSLLSAPGYDADTQLYHLVDTALRLDPAVFNPTQPAAEQALRTLLGTLEEFPFVPTVEEAEEEARTGNPPLAGVAKSVALAAMITPVVRGAMDVAPGTILDAPTPGSGKSYLVDLVNAVLNGQRCPVIAFAPDPHETEKRLVAELLGGNQLISIDNFNGILVSDLLGQAISQPIIKLRPLGTSNTPTVHNRFTVMMNGNNIKVSGDLVRRTIRCRIDAQVERPELRRFKRNTFDLILADRSRYVSACLVIVRAYLVAGCPDPCPPLAGFEHWSRLVRSALVWLNCADPVASQETIRGDDAKLAELGEILQTWADALGTGQPRDDGLTIEEARDKLRKPADDQHACTRLLDRLEQIGRSRGEFRAQKLGSWLSSVEGRVVGSLRLVRSNTRGHGGIVRWLVQNMTNN